MKNIFKKAGREITLIIAIIVMGTVFTLIESTYVTPKNLINILDQSTINGFLAIGVTFVILTGGIDLSVGAVLAMVDIFISMATVAGMNIYLAFVLGLLIGFVLGILNGILITGLKLQPFIATLGTCTAYRGIAYVITGGWPILNVPDKFRKFVDGDLGPVPNALIIMIIFTVLSYVLLKKTKAGIYIYSIGNNEEATKLSGINVNFYKTLAYAISGIGRALAGMVIIARLGSGEPSAGDGYELNAIAAAAIGGTSLAGGKGGVIGTVIGAILLQALKTGLVVISVDPYWQNVATGIIIILAVSFETIRGMLQGVRGKHIA